MVGSLLGKRQLSYGDDDEASSVAESNRNLVILSSQRPQFDLSQEASRMMESSCGNSGSGDSYLEKLPRRCKCQCCFLFRTMTTSLNNTNVFHA